MKTHTHKKLKIKSISELWDNLKYPNNIDVIRVPERERQGQKKIFEESITEYFQICTHAFKRFNKRKETGIKLYIRINSIKLVVKRKIFKAERKKRHIMY